MAHLQSTSAARRSVGVIGLGQMGWGITSALLNKAVENGMGREDFTRLDERLEAEARERSAP
jgi:3-hydroxyisobutyrate dehydrogenase-like beta-hydroxyacid dehydrogenase